jgi:UDPglucose 6-dehydrogenase
LKSEFSSSKNTFDARLTSTLTIKAVLYRLILEQSFVVPDCAARPEGIGAVSLVTASPTSAELIKYAANAFLALKISYANEIALLAECVGAEISEVARHRPRLWHFVLR